MATLAAEHSTRRGLRPVHWLMAGIVVIALTTAGYSLRGGAVVSYASVPEAMASPRPVQVFGYLYSKGAYDDQGRWTFDVQGEDGEVMTIVYSQTKPANFEQAISVVAIGKYDKTTEQFMADQLLVKCPSKYQEEGQTAQG
jgi:cytochrome c-type biogenesis protein CcmE